jgi:quinol monooxygenase YgiN
MYAFCQDMPGADESAVRKVEELLAGTAYDGMVAHVSGPVDGGWRIIDVWESEEHLARFRDQHLFPAFQQVFGGLPDGPREVRDVTSAFA